MVPPHPCRCFGKGARLQKRSFDQILREIHTAPLTDPRRSLSQRDQILVTREGLGEMYDTKIKSFFEEHLHEDEEIRYILDGSGFFDVRGRSSSG